MSIEVNLFSGEAVLGRFNQDKIKLIQDMQQSAKMNRAFGYFLQFQANGESPQ